MDANPPPPLITLTTDFGTRDGYVGAMKGVIRTYNPDVLIDDITHDIPPGDISSGAWALRTFTPFYPAGTVHVVVVDPGVGTCRDAIVAQADTQFFILPDNGLLSWIHQEATHLKAWTLAPSAWRPSGNSHTFHGRDLFSYAAATLACSRDLSVITDTPIQPHIAPWARIQEVDQRAVGLIHHVDRFGNAITNLRLPNSLEQNAWRIQVPDGPYPSQPLRRTYGEVAPGEALALIGSHGFLELAVRDGSAAETYGLRTGQTVNISRHQSS